MTWIGLLVGGSRIHAHLNITDFPVDMAVYREGVRAFLSGGEMYSVPMQVADLQLPFIYPPFGALALVPLTAPEWLDDSLAGDIMIILSNLLVLACLYLIFRTLMKEHSPAAVRAVTAVSWAAAMLIEPIELNNGFAQINVVIMALVFFDLVPRRRFLPQGTLLGIAAAIKLSPLAMGLFLLVRRDVRAILTAGISALVCTIIAALVRWDATVEFFSTTLRGMGTESEFGVNTAYQSNSSVKGVIMRFFNSQELLDAHGTLVNVLWLLISLTVILLGAWLMVALLRRDLTIDAILVNATVMLLISPVSWSHHWVWLALIIPVAAWRCVTLFPRPWFLGAVLALWSWFILSTPPKWWYGDAIDVFALSLVQKVLVSDFVWLALLSWVGLALALRTVPVVSPQIAVPRFGFSGGAPADPAADVDRPRPEHPETAPQHT
ncbi:MAG TPA: glycosyltransferase 87 family protein [Corynebacterium sp.]|nr:glycosyltransferase 87 family protein [Corynebacterium sp.]